MTHTLKSILTILAKSFLLFLLSTIQCYAAPSATGELDYYTNQLEFETAHPGLVKEDFEESPVSFPNSKAFAEPLDIFTDVAGAFAPGDILKGLVIQTVEGVGVCASLPLLVVPAGAFNNASKAVGANCYADTLEILFTTNVNAVGMDIFLHGTAAMASISAYDAGGDLLDSFSQLIGTTETFVGMYSSTKPIASITILPSAPLQAEYVDNIQFDRPFAWPLFLPAVVSKETPLLKQPKE